MEADPVAVVAQPQKRRGHAVGTDELVVAAVDQHQIGLSVEDFVDEIEQAEGIDRRNAAVDHLKTTAGKGVLQHQLQKAGETGRGRVGIADQRRGPQNKDAESILGFVQGKAILHRGMAHVLVLEKAMGRLRIDAIAVGPGQKQAVGRTRPSRLQD